MICNTIPFLLSLLITLLLSPSDGFNVFLKTNIPFLPKTTATATTTTTSSTKINHHPGGSTTATMEATGFIATELRGAAMKLHTRKQAPKEGQAEEPKHAHASASTEPYVPTHLDYLKFLVDSQHVYKAMEDIVNMEELQSSLSPFVDTGLERVDALETDINFLSQEYNVPRPEVGSIGLEYAQELRSIAARGPSAIPEFMCHYYNYYFAHTAGGRMIGKKMASLLLEKKTLEFYKWNGDLNEIKSKVKNNFEDLAAKWTREEKDMCVNATMGVFKGAGGINRYLNGGRGGHH